MLLLELATATAGVSEEHRSHGLDGRGRLSKANVLKTQQWATTIKNAERARLHAQEELMSPFVVI
jgi:hypothetical protein